MTKDEGSVISHNADACGLSLSEYMRRCALGLAIHSRVDAEALRELRRHGGLIKHLASSDRRHAYEYQVTLNLIQEAIRRLERAG